MSKPRLYYFAHRYSDADPSVRAANLASAKLRFDYLKHGFRVRNEVLWAPWIELAEAGVEEDVAWLVIDRCVRACDGIVLDLDGRKEPSPGMVRERDTCEAVGGKVEVVR